MFITGGKHQALKMLAVKQIPIVIVKAFPWFNNTQRLSALELTGNRNLSGTDRLQKSNSLSFCLQSLTLKQAYFIILSYLLKHFTQSLSRVHGLLVTPWTADCQAPLSMGFPRQKYSSVLPFPSPGESSPLRDQIHISCIAGILFPTEPQGKPLLKHIYG